MAVCTDGRCDGSGFLYDEETRRASAVLVPARAAGAQARGRGRGADSEALPGGRVRPRAAPVDRARQRAGRARGPQLHPAPLGEPRGRPRDLVQRRRRHRQDDAGDADLQGRDGGRPHGRDLLAAAAAVDPARDLRRRLALPPDRIHRHAVLGRPAAHRRRRRRAVHRLGARAALHDLQHALRGRQGGAADDQPRRDAARLGGVAPRRRAASSRSASARSRGSGRSAAIRCR